MRIDFTRSELIELVKSCKLSNEYWTENHIWNLLTEDGHFHERTLQDIIRPLFGPPRQSTLMMLYLDKILDMHGVEDLTGEERWLKYGSDWRYQYLNSGDCYNLTIIFDRKWRKLLITTIGDLVENQERRYVGCTK